MAASMAGRSPPTRATTTTTSRNSSTSLTRLSGPRALASTRVRTRRQQHRQRDALQPATPGEAALEPRQPATLAHLGVRDEVDVDVAGLADGGGPDAGPAQQRREPRAPAAAEHELGGVLRPGELQQRLGHVVADDLVVGAAEGLDQLSLPGQVGGAGAGEPVGAGDVDREQVTAGRAGGDARGPPDQGLALRRRR